MMNHHRNTTQARKRRLSDYFLPPTTVSPSPSSSSATTPLGTPIGNLRLVVLRRLAVTIPRPVWILLWMQLFWMWYDQQYTSQEFHTPPRRYVPPSASSPLSPFRSSMEPPYTGPSRIFSKQSKFPCGPLVQELPPQPQKGSSGGDKSHTMSIWQARHATPAGLFYIPQRQVASTTLAGMTARMARNMAQPPKQPHVENHTNNTTNMVCTARLVPMRAKRLQGRNRSQSFLWSMLRDPVERFVSSFFHNAVSLGSTTTTTTTTSSKNGNSSPLLLTQMQSYFQRHELNDYGSYFKTLSPRRYINVYRNDLYMEYMDDILESVDFLGILERWDESLAVLQLLLGLQTADMLYIPNVKAQGQGYYEYYHGQCVSLQAIPETLPHNVKEWFYQPDVYDFFRTDALVYQAANASLDLTIQQLGVEQVAQTVKQLQWAQRQRVVPECQNHVRHPCSLSTGQVQTITDCLVADIGCGYQCLDDIGKTLK